MEVEAKEKIVQMPLTGEYWNLLEADAVKCDRVPSRHAAWIVKRYYDGEAVARAQIAAGIGELQISDRKSQIADEAETASVQQQEAESEVAS